MIKTNDISQYSIFLYWENKKGRKRPEYLNKCLQTIRKKNSNVVLVTPENITLYIPKDKINPKIWKLDLIAQRSDYFRYLLIHHNGGLWLDFDTICLKNLDPIFKKLENYELVFQSEQFFAGRKGVFEDVIGEIEAIIASKMTSKYLNRILKRRFLNTYLKIKFETSKLKITPFKWTEIGIDCVLKHIDKYNVYRIEDYAFKPLIPYNWEPENNKIIFSTSVKLENFLNEKQMIVKLYNHTYDNNKKNQLVDEKGNLFNALLKKALER